MTTRNVIDAIDKEIAERRECIPQVLQWLRELAVRVDVLELRERARADYELEQAEYDN